MKKSPVAQLKLADFKAKGILSGMVLRTEHVSGDALPHKHSDFYELVVVRDGEALHHRSDSGDSRLLPGSVFLIVPGVSHYFTDYHSLSLVNILIRQSFVTQHQELLNSLPGYRYLLPPNGQAPSSVSLASNHIIPLIRLADQMMDEQCHERPGRSELLASLLMHSLLLILRNCSCTEENNHRSARILTPVIDYLSEHYEEHFTLPQLAKMAHASVPAFCRNFKDEVGCSPIEYILRLRIEKAQNLLSGKFYSISSVAEQLGFHDVNYFTRQFRKRVGCSPTQWSAAPHGLGFYPKRDCEEMDARTQKKQGFIYRKN